VLGPGAGVQFFSQLGQVDCVGIDVVGVFGGFCHVLVGGGVLGGGAVLCGGGVW
jgi:hypothetical protein